MALPQKQNRAGWEDGYVSEVFTDKRGDLDSEPQHPRKSWAWQQIGVTSALVVGSRGKWV